MNNIKTSLIRWTEALMGMPQMESISTSLAKIGLRGLGVNVHYDLHRSGEIALLSELSPALRKWICFDIGANTGEYTNALLAAGATDIVSFEPTPNIGAKLDAKFSENPKVTIVKMAVGEFIGDTDFYVAKEFSKSTLNSREGAFTALTPGAFDVHSVQMITVDEYSTSMNRFPNFVKIDVEGFEIEVLKGMKRLISEHPPNAIQFEFNQHHLKRRQNMGDFSELLPEYTFFRLAYNSRRLLDPSHYLANIYAYSNIVAIHKDFVATLRTNS